MLEEQTFFERYSDGAIRNNGPVELWDGCSIRALPICLADEWLEAAKLVARDEFNMKQLQDAFATANRESGGAGERAQALFSDLTSLQTVYYRKAAACVKKYFDLAKMPIDVESLSYGQVVYAFEVMFNISDPTIVSGLSRMYSAKGRRRMIDTVTSGG